MTRFLRYLKYSGIWLGLAINPYHWRVSWRCTAGGGPEENIINFGPFWIRVIIDDGEW